MKKISLSVVFLITFTQFSIAQYVPEGFNYQAVIRNTNGDLVINNQVDIEIVLKEGSSNGTSIYAEKHSKTTNSQGIVQLILGQGNVTQGNFSTIDWSSAAKYISIAVDIDGNNVFTDLGSTQLLSVPYALYAKNAGSGGGTTYDAGAGININGNTISAADNSATNEIQSLSINGDQISISNGNTITLPPNSGTDAQTLSVNGNQLAISNGNTVTLPTGTTYTAGSGISINGNAISATDNSTTNEIQSLTLNGAQLAISGGNTVTLPTGTTYTAGSGIAINGNAISATDNSVTNEIQSLSVNGNQLTISYGNTITLPTGTTYTAGSGIAINGNAISATDNSTTNEIQTISLNGNTLSLSNNGGSVNLPGTGTSLWTATGNDIRNANSGNVNIGTSSNQGDGALKVYEDGNQAAAFFQVDNPNSFYPAVSVYNNGDGNGITVNAENVGIYATSNNYTAISADSYAEGYHAELATPNYSGYFRGPLAIDATANPLTNTLLKLTYPNVNSNAIIDLENIGSSYKWSLSGGSTNSEFGAFSINHSSNNIIGTGLIMYDQDLLHQDNIYYNGSSFLMYSTSDSDPNHVLLSTSETNPKLEFGNNSTSNNASWQFNGLYMSYYLNGARKMDLVQNDIEPYSDGLLSLGNGGYRWSVVYAQNGVIQTSDKRYKQDVREISYGLSTLMQMRPVSYHWKSDKAGEKEKLGFIAQELETLVPEVVVHDQLSLEDIKSLEAAGKPVPDITDPYGVKYSELIPVLVKSIQEQQAMIEAMRTELDQMKAEIRSLKN
jgi:hypothetical protein